MSEGNRSATCRSIYLLEHEKRHFRVGTDQRLTYARLAPILKVCASETSRHVLKFIHVSVALFQKQTITVLIRFNVELSF